jgi:hypothetical protein
MNSKDIASKIIDLAAEYDEIRDYNIDIHENVVLETRIEFEEGFIDVYRNYKTVKTAFAWIKNQIRIFGADNTGGWHKHPFGKPSKHLSSNPFDIEQFVEECVDFIQEDKI